MMSFHYRRFVPALLGIAAILSGARYAGASDLVEMLPLTDRVLMLHFNDGRIEHHRRGEPRSAERVITDPLDTAAASRPDTYTIVSGDDPRYRAATAPRRVFRKTKGTDFAWFADKWVGDHAVNERPDYTAEHWLYLELPTPLAPGRTYTVRTGALARNGNERRLTFVPARVRTEAIHVNTLGYVPDAPEKFAYVYQWMGDGGSLDLKAYAGKPFHLTDTRTGRSVYSGTVRFRMPRTAQETYHTSDTPDGNFLGADVWECDFSAFKTPGSYVVTVEGIGSSWPFRIDRDVYRAAFRTTIRGLYHNRSGIALTKPYTTFERPAPHHPKLTPGFANKLRYTRVRFAEWGSEGGDAKQLMAESPGTLEDAWGWYQDAGDWDSYPTHLRVAQETLLAYEMGPRKFTDGELNLPESGNGVPDLLDEAAWLPRFCYRLRQELLRKGWGTGGVALRVSGDAFGSDEGTRPDGTKVGRGSWEDTDRTWMVAGEDPWSTYRYAGVAANLAHCFRLAGVRADPQGIDWAKEARESYAWAQAHTRPGDESLENGSLRDMRAYAAASLLRLTGDTAYGAQFARDTESVTADALLWDAASYGPFVYALGGGAGDAARDPAVLARIRAAVLHTADESCVSVPARRALRWGGNYSFPMLVGQQTTPWVLEGAVAYTLTRKTEPERARRYRAALYTTCDYFLGTNALNQTWVTGLGPRHPRRVFHMDAWYNGKSTPHPGIIPYGPWRKDREQGVGPWDKDWVNKSVYPAIDAWPGNERWFDDPCAPMIGEFTVHQNTGPAATLFGFLCAEAVPIKPTGAGPLPRKKSHP